MDGQRYTRASYEANPKRCLKCGAPIPYEKRENRFCGSSCAASHNNVGITRHAKHSTLCACGNIKKRANKYCETCASTHNYHRVFTLEQATSEKIRRRILLQERGHRCELCGGTEWLGHQIPLEVHHVDGDSDNNTQDNLKLLCSNCHAIQPNFKGGNRYNGKRQQMRRKRYEDGKTW
jgi:5-methylcytosine-specific restriction endonuclease McrA